MFSCLTGARVGVAAFVLPGHSRALCPKVLRRRVGAGPLPGAGPAAAGRGAVAPQPVGPRTVNWKKVAK